MSVVARVRRVHPVGVARRRYAPTGDTQSVTATAGTSQVVAVTGPPGPPGPAGAGLQDGPGVSIIGNVINLNIEELPVAPAG